MLNHPYITVDKTKFTAMAETLQSAVRGQVFKLLLNSKERQVSASKICGPGAKEQMEDDITHV